MLTAAPRATAAATSLLAAAFDRSIAFGALLGGLVVDRVAALALPEMRFEADAVAVRP